MSAVRLLVGTRKGAFVLTSDGKRKEWKVSGPHFAGWEIYHMKGSPVNPNRIYASQTSGWFGQQVQRSDDGGETWEPVGKDFVYIGTPGTHQWYDGTQHPWEFKRVWHFEPSLSESETVYAGAEDAALFRSTDGGTSWQELPALREAKGKLWQPGAGGMCLHTILLDPDKSGSHFRRHLRGRRLPLRRWRRRAGRQSTKVSNLPTSCPIRRRKLGIASTGSRCIRRVPDVLFMQKHWDVMRSDNAGGDVE